MSLSCELLFAVFVNFLDCQFQSTFSQIRIEQNGNPMLPPPPHPSSSEANGRNNYVAKIVICRHAYNYIKLKVRIHELYKNPYTQNKMPSLQFNQEIFIYFSYSLCFLFLFLLINWQCFSRSIIKYCHFLSPWQSIKLYL